MQQLSAQDASFIYFETPQVPLHVGGIGIYDPSTARESTRAREGTITFKGILENVERRLHLARCFRQRLVMVPMSLDHPYWIEDPDFDVEFHVRHIALPKPGDWRQLCIQAARLHSRPLDLARPLWEMYVIEGLDNIPGLPAGSFAVVSKIHHAAIDGVTGAEMTAALHDLSPDAEPPPPEKPWLPEPVPTAWELLARSSINNLGQPLRLARILGQSVPAIARVAQRLRLREFRPPGAVPRTRFNATVSPHRVVEGRTFPLDEIRSIKNVVEGATVNDVVLTICGGSLRKYLETKGELPKESLIAMAPISVRAKEEKGAGGNRVSGMLVPIHTDLADPLERLKAVHQAAVESKELTSAIGARLLMDYSQFIPAALAGLAARLYTSLGLASQMNPVSNCVITNVPGPQFPLYSGGARLEASYGMGPVVDGMGLIHPVFSYCGRLSISVTSCRRMMPDPALYAQCLEDSFAELKAATSARSSANPARGSGRNRKERPDDRRLDPRPGGSRRVGGRLD